nr:MAG TPA: hypothetical protein [Caudoviricetes sp.]
MKTIKFNDKKHYNPLEISIIIILGIIISFPVLALLTIFLMFMFTISPLITIFAIIFIIFKIFLLKDGI